MAIYKKRRKDAEKDRKNMDRGLGMHRNDDCYGMWIEGIGSRD